MILCSLFMLGLVAADDAPITSVDSPAIKLETVNRFLDDFWRKNAIAPGISVGVVYDGKLLTARGYGMADPVKGRFVDPEKTVFRIASVSKPVVAAAVLKLVDEGKLKLDVDINTYLKRVRIPDAFGKPVTLKDLLTHTAGFEDKNIGTAAPSADKVLPLEEYLLHNIPARVTPPGVAISYSNQGYAIAGLVVEQVSGIPFNQFADERIFKPLGMTETSFALREDLLKEVALGHEIVGRSFIGQPFDFLHCAPPGNVLSTASDFSRFLAAQMTGLEGPGGAPFLSESSLRLMHESQFRHHPDMPGWTLGFSERRQGTLIGYGHSGALRGFASDVSVWPSAKLAIFLAYNCSDEGAIGLRERLTSDLLNHFVPDAKPPQLPSANAAPAESKVASRVQYFGLRRNQSGLDKLAILAGVVRVASVGFSSEGDMIIGGRTWKSMGEGVYRASDGQIAKIRPADKETPELLFIGTSSLDRSAWYDEIHLQMVLVGFTFVAGAIAILISLAGFVRHLVGGKATALRRYWTVSATAGLFELTAAGGLQIATMVIPKYDFTLGIPIPVVAILVIFHLAAGLAVATILLCLVAWLRGRGSLVMRLLATLFAVGHGVFVWLCWHWNILGFQT